MLAPVRAFLRRLQGNVETSGHIEVANAAVSLALAEQLNLQHNH
jgi:hypothetical protein